MRTAESSAASTDKHLGRGWLLLTAALALHVADGGTHDFLSLYNPTVLSLRERWAWLPMPTFTYEGWLTGLVAAIFFLLLLTPFAYRRARWWCRSRGSMGC
jgi:hypothetical protein